MDALILSCGTGGGHNAAAYAIKEELIRRGDNVEMINPYLLHSKKLADRIDKTYISVAQKVPSCFGTFYKVAEVYRKLPCKSPVYHLNRKMAPIMDEYLKNNHFDVVIMTHLFPAEIMTQMKNSGIAIPKTIFIATDYTCIPFTEETDCDAYIIPAEELRNEFQSRGISSEKIFPFGIPVRSGFSSQCTKEEAQRSLELSPDKKYFLISGGSIGAGKLKKSIKFLYKNCDDSIKLIVICGNNQKLYNSLVKKYGNSMMIIKSTNQMATYLRASDLYFSKPGGLSSTEAAVMGVPLIHLSPIPGCETRNINFFSAYGMNIKYEKIKNDSTEYLSLLHNEDAYNSMIEKQHKMINGNSASDICDFAEKLIHN